MKDQLRLHCNFEPEALRQTFAARASDLAAPWTLDAVWMDAARPATGGVLWVFGPAGENTRTAALEEQVSRLRNATADQAILLPGAAPRWRELLTGLELYIWDDRKLVFSSRVESPQDDELRLLIDVPYRRAFWEALALDLHRHCYGQSAPPCKAIAVDGDYTLWQGACSEMPISISAEHKHLHAFLRQKRNEGKLLCLLTKNAREDIDLAFATIRELDPATLTLDDFVYIGTSWDGKSNEIARVVAALDIDPASIAFLDDSETECFAVRSRLPQVTVIQIPEHGASELLADWCWFLDRHEYEIQGGDRTVWYRNDTRLRASQPVDDSRPPPNFQAEFKPLGNTTEAERTRICELSMRTSQFNFSGRRWSKNQLVEEIDSGRTAGFVVTAKSAINDLGLVGAALLQSTPPRATVQNAFLSCRSLGRGVEPALFQELADFAHGLRCDQLDIEFHPTTRNEPARRWLTALGATGPVTRLKNCSSESVSGKDAPPPVATDAAPRAVDWHSIARAALSICWKVGPSKTSSREDFGGEDQLVATWSEILGTPPDRERSIFEQGADSVTVASFVAALRSTTGARIALTFPYEHRTIREMAAALATARAGDTTAAALVQAPAGGIPVFIVTTPQRLTLAARCFQSIPDNGGPAVLLPLILPSPSPPAIEGRVFASASSTVLPDERRSLMDVLLHSGCPEQVLRFLLEGPPIDGPTTGANRNHTLLLGAGTTFISLDDDVLWSFVRPQTAGNGPGAHSDPCSYWSTPPPLEPVEPIGILTAALDTSGMEFGVAFAGVHGDCGWSAPFGIWGQPLGYLALVGESRQRFANDDYLRNICNRNILRVSDRTVPVEFGQTYCFAVRDAGPPGKIPPFFPLGRGQDLIWSLVCRLCGVPLVQAPLAVEHRPPERAPFTRNLTMSTAGGIDVCRYLIAAIRSATAGPAKLWTVESLGEAISTFAAGGTNAIHQSVMSEIRSENESAVAWLESQLSTAVDLSEQWKEDVREYCLRLVKAQQLDGYGKPLDLPLDLADAQVFLRQSLQSLGDAFRWWPKIASLARAVAGHKMRPRFASSLSQVAMNPAPFISSLTDADGESNVIISRRIPDAPTLVLVPNTIEDVILYLWLTNTIASICKQASQLILPPFSLNSRSTVANLNEIMSIYMRGWLPRSPMLLLGYCHSGRIAVELAARMQQSGREVRGVVLVEAFFEYKTPSVEDRLMAFGSSLVHLGWWLAAEKLVAGLRLTPWRKLPPRWSEWARLPVESRRRDSAAPHVSNALSASLPVLNCPMHFHRSAEINPWVSRVADAGWSRVSNDIKVIWHQVRNHEILKNPAASRRVFESAAALLFPPANPNRS